MIAEDCWVLKDMDILDEENCKAIEAKRLRVQQEQEEQASQLEQQKLYVQQQMQFINEEKERLRLQRDAQRPTAVIDPTAMHLLYETAESPNSAMEN